MPELPEVETIKRIVEPQIKGRSILSVDVRNAQVYAIGYYAKKGFEVVSDEFMEDGIPHVKMERVIIE